MQRSHVVFFLSGTAALAYQVVWMRWLARVLGSDAAGVTTVLVAFLLGMALGARWLGPPLARVARPAVAYLLVQLGVAAWALGTISLVPALEALGSAAPRPLVALAALLPPTLLMGATFPLMGRLSIRGDRDAGPSTAGFYAANTYGAAAGALLAGFLVLPRLGLAGGVALGAAIDALAGVLAVAWLRDAPASSAVPPREARAASASLSIPFAAFACGAAGLGLEVLFTRQLVALTGASVYAYAIVLGVFLFGIASGSLALGPRLGPGGSARPLASLACFAIALAPLLGVWLVAWRLGRQDVLHGLSNVIPLEGSALRLWVSHAVLAGLALLPVALALGAALPALVRAGLDAAPDERSRVLGAVYASNTLGAAFGASAAGYVLLPALGPESILVAASSLAALAGLALAPAPRRLSGYGLVAVALALVLTTGTSTHEGHLVYERAGRVSTVAVERRVRADSEVLALRVDGKVVASTEPIDLRLQRLLGAIPAWLHGDVEDALVVGLGTGMTAGSLLSFPTVDRVRVVEISEAVVDASRHFDAWNGRLLDDPRVELEIADGRRAVRDGTTRYDLVTADPIHPWTRGSSDLYALEHFEAMAARLAPGGVASQWLPLYQLALEDVRTVAATWCAVFPHRSAWLTAYDLVLVGALDGPVDLPTDRDPQPLPDHVAGSLAEVGVADACSLAALLCAGSDELEAFAAGRAPMREDRPVLEFRAPLSFLAGTSREALAWSVREEVPDLLPPCARQEATRVRGALLRFVEASRSDWRAAAEAYGAELVPAR